MRPFFISWTQASRGVALIAVALTGACAPEAEMPLGESVQPLELAAEAGSGRPRLSVSGDGEVLLSWTEPVSSGRHRLRFARREGQGWSAPQTVVEGDDWFVNWADFPSVQRAGSDRLVAHYLQKTAEATFAYDVRVVASENDGSTWSEPESPHDDGTPTEHGFVSMVPLEDGRMGIFWLDGRKTGAGGTGEETQGESGHGGHSGEMTLRYAELGASGAFEQDVEVDGRTCDCCQTAAVAVPGGVAVFYRDRSEAEIRDISVVRRIGGVWEAPRTLWPDGWEIAGCPVNGPAAAAAGNRVVVAWFTAAGGRPAVRVAVSTDGAASFDPPLTLSLDRALGRVGIVLAGEDAVVSWMEQDADETWVRIQRVYANGGLGPLRSVVRTVPDRGAGFPQLARLGSDSLVVAWTQVTGQRTRVRTAILPLDARAAAGVSPQ